jgi:hypothetical protein
MLQSPIRAENRKKVAQGVILEKFNLKNEQNSRSNFSFYPLFSSSD